MSIPSRGLKSTTLIVAVAVTICGLLPSGTAHACSLVTFRDDGRYVGGDLSTQIAIKANTIQIVRVTARHLVRRTYTAGEWYLNFGTMDVPTDRPEYTDEFVFKLEPIETLKVGQSVPEFLQDGDLRVRGFAPEAFPEEIRSTNLEPPNALPVWLADRPGDNGYAFIGASEEAGLGGGECSSPYVLEVGQILLAFRNSNGDLYPASGAFPLEINTEFSTGRRQRERLTLNMQSLVPITGPDDAFVARLRQALAAQPNSTRN